MPAYTLVITPSKFKNPGFIITKKTWYLYALNVWYHILQGLRLEGKPWFTGKGFPFTTKQSLRMESAWYINAYVISPYQGNQTDVFHFACPSKDNAA